MKYKYQEVVFDRTAKIGYILKWHRINCDLVKKEGDEILVKLHKNKWLPAQIIRIMAYELEE